MTEDWIKFEEAGKRMVDRITITKGGTIGFPTLFYNKNSVKSFKYVILYYSPAEKAIGIELSNDDTEKGKLNISHSNQGYGASVNSRSFFRRNEIDYVAYSDKYKWTKEPFNGKELFVIRLTEKNQEQKTNEAVDPGSADSKKEPGASPGSGE